MTFLVALALALALEGLRLALFGRFTIQPDFLLGMTVILALARRPPVGAVAGFLLGAFRDLVYGTPIGVSALSLALVGWAVGSLGRSVYRESGLTQGLAILVAGLGQGILVYLLLRGGDIDGLISYMARVTLPSSMLTAALVPAALHEVQRFSHRQLKFHERKILVRRG